MAGNALEIRSAKIKDVFAIAELKDELDRHHRYSGLWPPEGGRKENLGRYRRMIRGKTDRILVAEYHPGEIVGYLTFTIRTRKCADRDFRRVGVIGEVLVTKAKRRQGIGRALVKTATEYASKRDIKHVTLRNAIMNKPANLFWRRLSFTPVLCTRTTTVSKLDKALRNASEATVQVARE